MSIDISTKKRISLTSDGTINNCTIALNASKSESNRMLVIKALSRNQIKIENLAVARDTQTMISLINQLGLDTWNVLDAGTTMRFLTAFLAVRSEGKTITGTQRMQQRPIGPLVDALRLIGANISYVNKEGFPPLNITKFVDQLTDKIDIPGNISSQYISALLMIAPCLPNGLTINLTGEIFSRPYINMTLSLMAKFGVNHDWHSNSTVHIKPTDYQSGSYKIESDWSGASYWYSLVALASKAQIKLLGLRKDSFQGDRVIAEIMDSMGVQSSFVDDGVILTKKEHIKSITLDFKDCPDLAQTVLVVAAIKKIKLRITGLESLRIKETDRIAAMMSELNKIGGQLTESDGVWHLKSSTKEWGIQTVIDTYEDHRMAMAFAPLCMIKPITIEDPLVVNKSYPDFWRHLANVDIKIE